LQKLKPHLKVLSEGACAIFVIPDMHVHVDCGVFSNQSSNFGVILENEIAVYSYE
jgi:hypothetical protein